MSGILDAEGGLMSALNKFWDMVILSIMWTVLSGYCVLLVFLAANLGLPNIFMPILVCLQAVTLGPATAALYYTSVKNIRRGRGYVTKEFFKSFKNNFKMGSRTALFILLGIYIAWLDYQYANILTRSGNNIAFLYFTACNIFAIFIVIMTAMVFPIISRFNVSFKELLKLTMTMSIRHIFTTIMVIVIIAVSALAVYLFTPALFIIPAGAAVLCSMFIERVFKKYTPVPEGTDEETGKDRWYYE